MFTKSLQCQVVHNMETLREKMDRYDTVPDATSIFKPVVSRSDKAIKT